MNIVAITSDLTTAFLLLAVMTAAWVSNRNADRKDRYFFLLCLAEEVGLLFDASAFVFDTMSGAPLLGLLTNMGSMCASPVVMSCFALYTLAYLSDFKDISKYVFHLILILNGIDIVFKVIGSITGDLFVITEAGYVEGPWTSFLGISQIVSLLLLIYVVLQNRQLLSKHDLMSFLVFILVPTTCVVALSVLDLFDFTYVASGFSVLVIFTTLQSNAITQARNQAMMMERASNVDTLTHLPNRRAYSKAIQHMEPLNTVGTIFCDMNRLKHVNDTEGHEAGDAYICKFADILREQFDNDSVFRISGDEFVVLLPDIAQDAFEAKAETLRKAIGKAGGIAAMGISNGPGLTVLDQVRAAETQMYEDKERFYSSTGSLKRVQI